jgi:hypothetical protein
LERVCGPRRLDQAEEAQLGVTDDALVRRRRG